MANKSSGTLMMSVLELPVLNDRLHQIRDELDGQMGLRGPINTYDSTRYYDSNNQLLHCWGDSGLTS